MKCGIPFVFLIVLLSANSVRAAVQLPPETSIPGAKELENQTLPPESVRPGQQLASTPLPLESSLPPYSSQNSTQEPNVAPDPEDVEVEMKLVGPEERDAIREFSNRPLLRIQSDGPIATIRAIQFSSDSKRLFAGGFDKTLHVWQRLQRQGKDIWGYEKPVYWQINRAAQGRVLAIAAGTNAIAFGGVGASASNGEIALVNPDTLEFSQALANVDQGHVHSISSIGSTADNQTLVSMDVTGRVVAWPRDAATGNRNPREIRKGDVELFGQGLGNELFKWRARGGGIAVSDNGTVIYPELVQPYQPGSTPQWQLIVYSPQGARTKLATPRLQPGNAPIENLQGAVVGIACSSNGKRVIAADLRNSGRVFIWDLDKSSTAQVIRTNMAIRCLDISKDGSRVAIGSSKFGENQPRIQLMNWVPDGSGAPSPGSLTEVANWNSADAVEACTFNPDASQLAYGHGGSLEIVATEGKKPSQTLQASMQQTARVAFSATQGNYQFAIQSDLDSQFQWKFDPEKLNLVRLGVNAAEQWQSANPNPDQWQIVDRAPEGLTAGYWVNVRGKQFCQLPIVSSQDGKITRFAFVADPNSPADPAFLIVGTSGKNHLYAYRLGAGQCELVREYRGHTSPVTSVGVSADNQYIVSAAQDGTVSVWKLDQAARLVDVGAAWRNRWGAEFAIQNKQLVVKQIVEDGPLYFRGVREGDVIVQIAWTDENEEQVLTDADAIRARLKIATTDHLLKFEYRRGAAKQPIFYLYPAWQPLASFAWDRQREWAFWTPYGYYDASFNGHKFFGWQINQGVSRPVKFFRAAELKEEFERPKMMQNLLTQGSVAEAFRVSHSTAPGNLSERLIATSRLKPTITIVSTNGGPPSQSPPKSAELVARIELAEGVSLGRVKAFANGVPATGETLTDQQTEGGMQSFEYRFRFDLPHDSKIKLQVLASSNLGHGAMAETVIDGPPRTPETKTRVFVMSLGVSDYHDSQIPRLDFAHLNAESVLKNLPGAQLESEDSVLLTQEEVSKGLWMVTSRALAEEMKSIAGPDDLLIVYLSGHGFRDSVTEEYFYLTSESSYADLLSRRYSDCISFDDLHSFGEIPCRKLVILDTCHSGSLQALRQQNLKSVVRTLENDLYFTLTASEGSQEAFESKQRGLGLFTARLIDALNGQSDQPASGGNGDGSISLNEVIQFVKSTVPNDAAGLGSYQYPTASPVDLLGLADIRIKDLEPASNQ